MLGRGLILNPGLPVTLRGGDSRWDEKTRRKKFREFQQRLWTATGRWISATGMSYIR